MKRRGVAWWRVGTGAATTGAIIRRDRTTWQKPPASRRTRRRTRPRRTAGSSWSATEVGGCPANGPPLRDVTLRSAPAPRGSPRRTPTHPSNHSFTQLPTTQEFLNSFQGVPGQLLEELMNFIASDWNLPAKNSYTPSMNRSFTSIQFMFQS